MKQPPKYPLKFLRWFCREDFLEEIEGNLVEIFEAEYDQSPKLAEKNFTSAVIRHFRPAFIRPFKSKFSSAMTDMLRHNILITFRNFAKYKSTFFINMAGLSTGLAVVLFVYLWVNDEWNKNKFNANDDRLYQVMQNLPDADGSVSTSTVTPGILAEALAKEMPEVEMAVSLVPPSWFIAKSVMSYNGKKIKTDHQYASADFLNVFSIDVIRGDRTTALSGKYNLLISDELAERMFGGPDAAMGKTVDFRWESNSFAYQIAGVYRLPSNAVERFDVLSNYEVFLDDKDWLREWGNSDPHTIVLLKEGSDPSAVQDKLTNFLQTKWKDARSTLLMQRYSDTYLYNRYENGQVIGGRIEYVRLFSVVAIVILIIACINFMNLSTARATRRVKEIGVKKAIGAGRGALAGQFLAESMSLAFMSAFVALALVWMLLPAFNILSEKYVTLPYDLPFIGSVVAVVVITGFVSGSYPSFYLSRFRAGDVLKGKVSRSISEIVIRKGLVVFQYAMSFMLIVGVVIVYRQIDYLQSRNLGYDREHIIHFSMEMDPKGDTSYFASGGALQKDVETMMNELKQAPGVSGVANFFHDLTGMHGGLAGVDWEAGDEDLKLGFASIEVGYDFIPLLGIQIVEGRGYSREFSDERSKIIFNETAIKKMGLKNPIGHKIKLWGEDREIIGVAKDFHFESLYEEVHPLMVHMVPFVPKVMVKVEGDKISESIAALKKIYEEHYPGLTFEYSFLDDDYNALYSAEQRVSVLSRIAAGLAIFISCLGLYGLMAFTVERRKKEISVRKVFGASQMSILRLLSSEFTWLVVIAMVVGMPLIWFGGTVWLESFAYRQDLSWWYFIAGAGAVLLITLLTVGMNTARASNVNPAETLRNE